MAREYTARRMTPVDIGAELTHSSPPSTNQEHGFLRGPARERSALQSSDGGGCFTKGCLAFVGRALDVWAYVNKVRIDFARPGKPTHNAYVKSFNGRLRALGKGRR
jgi:transposase InsO family protein